MLDFTAESAENAEEEGAIDGKTMRVFDSFSVSQPSLAYFFSALFALSAVHFFVREQLYCMGSAKFFEYTAVMSLALPTATLQLDDSTHFAPLPLWRMSVRRYHQLVEAGIFTPRDKVELIRGYIVQKMSKKPAHSQATRRLQAHLARLLGFDSGWLLSNQEPITTDDSEPEPDFAILRGGFEQYDRRHPVPSDVGLLIEVSDATLSYDQQVKKPLYAEAGIPTYWIVNIPDQQIEVYSEPHEGQYRVEAVYSGEDKIVVRLDGRDFGRIRAHDILPQA